MSFDTDSSALDAGQYSHSSIRKYEAIYGRDFISPGGRATARAILALAGLAPGAQVLDAGCGIGGAAFLMAAELGARVHGVDVSQNMIALAQERCLAAGLERSATFERADLLRYEPAEAYDLVHSRDAFLHIGDKSRLMAVLWRCLRPGGQLLFSDYLAADGPPSPEFAAYIQSRGYHLCTLRQYRAHLEWAGFQVLRAEDRTAEFAAILERELDQLAASDLSEHERAELAESWAAKLRRARAGEQRWGVLHALRPEDART